MNKSRRKILGKVIGNLEGLEEVSNVKAAIDILQEAQSDVDYCAEEEQEALDNLPENLEYSTRHDDFEENVNNLETASGNIEDCITTLEGEDEYKYGEIQSEVEEAIEQIEEAMDR